jgi:hypothetical protein
MTHQQKMAFLAMLLASGAVMSQTPAAPGAAAPASGSNCGKPEPHPGRLSSDMRRKQWNKDLQTWQDCMKKYVTDVQVRADKAVKDANAVVAESNAAVAEYNAAVKDVQAQIDANTK